MVGDGLVSLCIKLVILQLLGFDTEQRCWTSLACQHGVPEDCKAPGASHRSWFLVQVCPTMLSYDKEVAKTNNINVLHPHLLFNICLHFFSWNLYYENLNVTAMGAFPYYQWRLREILTLWSISYKYYCLEWKKIKQCFLSFNRKVLEQTECIAVKFNTKTNEISWNILLITSWKAFELLEHFMPNQKTWSLYWFYFIVSLLRISVSNMLQ